MRVERQPRSESEKRRTPADPTPWTSPALDTTLLTSGSGRITSCQGGPVGRGVGLGLGQRGRVRCRPRKAAAALLLTRYWKTSVVFSFFFSEFNLEKASEQFSRPHRIAPGTRSCSFPAIAAHSTSLKHRLCAASLLGLLSDRKGTESESRVLTAFRCDGRRSTEQVAWTSVSSSASDLSVGFGS